MININKARNSRILLMYVLLMFFIVVLIFPIITLFIRAFLVDGQFVGIDNFKTYFLTPALFASLKNSLFVSTVASCITVVISFIFAYGVHRTNIKLKKTVNFIALLPLFIPTMTHAIALIYLFGENGLFTTGFFGLIKDLSFHFPLYGKWGIILAECIFVFPALYMMFTVAFNSCDYRLYEAGDILGASNARMFRTITLPSMKYTIVSAFFSSFTMIFSDFGIAKVLGGNYNLLATDIYKQVIGQSNITMGATVGILLVIPSIISFIIDIKVSKKSNALDSNAKEFKIKDNKIRDIIIGALVYLVVAFIMCIFIAIILAAFINQWPYDLTFTLKWFTINTVGLSAIHIFINTIFVSLSAAILGTIIVIFTAYITQRFVKFKKITRIIDLFGIIPLAIPGLVIGLSYLLFFNESKNPLKFFYGTFIIIVLSNIIHFFSMPYITMKSAIQKIDKEYENVSETMGVPWYSVFDKVILVLLQPAIIEIFQYYFLNSMMTVSALVFLYTSKTKVAAVEMLATYDEGFVASTAAIAIMILITNLIVKYVIILLNKYSNEFKKDINMYIYKTLQIINEQNLSQRAMAKEIGVSLGKMNMLINKCVKEEYIIKYINGKKVKYAVTDKGFELLRQNINFIKKEQLSISRDSNKKINTAVILAAGKKNDFNVSPAGLFINGEMLLNRSIKILKDCGITKVIVVLGYGKDIIKENLEDSNDIVLIENNDYENTGSMSSLELVKNYIDDDFILVEGDLYFEPKGILELINSAKRECLVITNVSESGDEGFVQLKNDCLFKLGKDIHQFNRVDGEMIGISKISYKLFELMIKEYKENMNKLLNYEYILLDVSRDFKVRCIKIKDFKWGEIDNKDQYYTLKNRFDIK